MEVFVDVIYSQFIDYELFPQILRDRLEKVASYAAPGFRFSYKYKSGVWDGRYYLLNSMGRVPTGLIGMLVAEAKDMGYEIKVKNNITYPENLNKYTWTGPELRDYQIEAFDECIRRKRGIVELPTRTGKTLCMAKIIQHLGLKVIYLVAGKESMDQAVREIKEFVGNCTVGFYGGGKKNLDADIVIGLIESFRRCKKNSDFDKLKNREVIIIDEVHRAGADTIYKFFMRIPAPYRFGFSGTAFRADNKDLYLYALTGRKIYVKSQKEMWETGFIEEPTVVWVPVQTVPIHRAMNYRHHYDMGIIENEFRNNLIIKLVERHPKDQILISVENIAHGEILKAKLKLLGAVFVSGEDKGEFRDKVFDAFTKNELRIVIATRIFNESLTFPFLNILINASGGKSTVQLIQKFGRVQGQGEKNAVIIYDFEDLHSYYLIKHSKIRKRELTKRGYEQKVLEFIDS